MFSPLAFSSSLDIAKRACQHTGTRQITALFPPDLSVAAGELSEMYHKVRVYELRRNLWMFATRKAPLRALDVGTLYLVPAEWELENTYAVGGIVTYGGVTYFSLINGNTGITPGDANPTAWTQYFGPLTAEPWGISTGTATTATSPPSYYAGELVYYPIGPNPTVFLSTTNGNTDQPGTFPLWSATTQYNIGDTVGIQVLSQPGNIPVFSQPGDIPAISQVYQSAVDANIGITPGSSPADWTLVNGEALSDEMVGQNWLRLDSTVVSRRIIWPVGCGPSSDMRTRNVFKLPNGWLRDAPEQPRRGTPYMGAPLSNPLDDFEYDGDFLVTTLPGPLIHRFVADISAVSLMDPMFCEGFAASLGRMAAPRITEDVSKIDVCAAIYKQVMGDARAVNAIIQGPIEMMLDDYIACRL